ncbi:MAG: hypothetical protein ACYTEK_14750 [Planctomycetota bacterium]|jgi:hypothetical protein
MFKCRIRLGWIVCLLIALLVTSTLSQTRTSRQTADHPGSRRSQQMTWEERQKQFKEQVARRRANAEQWMAERQREFEQRAKDRANGKDARRNESIKQALEMTDAQWKVVEAKINRIYFLQDQSGISMTIGGGASGYSGGGTGYSSGAPGGSSGSSVRVGAVSTGTGMAGGYRMQSSSSGGIGWGVMGGVGSGPLWRLADRELTEGEKSCERLLVLLEDKDSRDEQIEQGIVALRQAREDAAKELAKARQELREVLTFRQQATLLMIGLLD